MVNLAPQCTIDHLQRVEVIRALDKSMIEIDLRAAPDRESEVGLRFEADPALRFLLLGLVPTHLSENLLGLHSGTPQR